MLIALYSSTLGSGKSTVANFLVQSHGFALLSFASPIKSMTNVLLTEFGYSPDEAYHMTHVTKNAPVPELASTIDVRQLLQTLGTEWGRQCIHPDIWLRCWLSRYLVLSADGATNIVVDDVRFENEASLISRLGGHLWKVERPNEASMSTHSSEGGLDHLRHFDDPSNDYSIAFSTIINNNNSIEDLHRKLNVELAILNANQGA